MADDNKPIKYTRYAVGEIVLVVIGILIALQINNWNENRKQEQNETLLLLSLRNEINADIEFLDRFDSEWSVIRKNAYFVDSLFNNARSAKDFIDVSHLWFERFDGLNINRSAYNEMLNTGNLYSLKNKVVKNLVNDYYLTVDQMIIMVKEITRSSYGISNRENVYPFWALKIRLEKILDSVKRLDTSWINNPKMLKIHLKKNLGPLKGLDTSWINNPKSTSYGPIQHWLHENIRMNIKLRFMATGNLRIKAKQLEKEITKELEQRK